MKEATLEKATHYLIPFRVHSGKDKITRTEIRPMTTRDSTVMTKKEQKGIFWGDGNILYLIWMVVTRLCHHITVHLRGGYCM